MLSHSALAFVHRIVAWYPSSSSLPQMVHVGFVVIIREDLFFWIARASIESLHVKIFTL
jgi:hypothetical protein